MAETAPTVTGWTAHGVPDLHVRPGAVEDVGVVVTGLRIQHALVVTDAGVRAAGWADRAAQAIRTAGATATVWDEVRPDPGDATVERCSAAVAAGQHDGLVAVGGGSCIDVAKAAAGLVACGGRLRQYEGLGRLTVPGPAVVAVATTPGGGAEISRHAVIADAEGRKYAVSGPHLAPRAVVVDPATFASAPRDVLVNTVLDSLIHAIEAAIARAATPYTDLFAMAALAGISRTAGAVRADEPDRTVIDLITGCLAAGVAMAEANAGLIHALGYPLTSEYGIAHGRANTLVAGAALRVVGRAAPDRCAGLVRLWAGAVDLASAFEELARQLGVSQTLADYGVSRTRLAALAHLATGYQPVLRNAPVALTEDELTEIYDQAWSAGRALR